MRTRTAQRLQPFGTTIFSEMSRLATEHGAVNLSQGFPDFDGPDFVKNAAIQAINQGHNQYARSPGVPELDHEIARRTGERTGLDIDPMAEVTVTSGCTEAIAATLMGLVNPGEEVVLFEPYYDSYRACVAMAGATPRFVSLREKDGRFSFDPDALRTAFNERTSAVLLNTPHNPTGSVFTRDELTLIADLCKQHDALAFSDEVYEELVFEGEHISIAALPGMRERTVTLSSLGKTFSLTGWKVGWAIAPPELSAGIRSAHQFLTFSTATPLQHAAAVALREGDEYIQSLRTKYCRARDLLTEGLSEVGFRVIVPEGTYFVLADHREIAERLGAKGDTELAMKLITEVGVATIPPSAFCDSPELCANFLRFAFCKEEATLVEAIRRLKRLDG